MKPRELIFSEVEFEFTAEPEHDHPKDHFEFPEHIAFALECEIEPARWFCAKMTAKWGGLKGVTYLGACSYNTFEEFLEQEGDNLKQEALADLNRHIAGLYKKIVPLLTEERA